MTAYCEGYRINRDTRLTPGKVQSKTKLLAYLEEKGLVQGEDFSIGYEAFGRKVLAFIYWKRGGMEQRKKMEDCFYADGWKFSPSYCRKSGNCSSESPCSEVQVSYFKAWHWDE